MFLLLLLWPPSGESCRPFRLRRLKELERVEGLERLERWHEAKPEGRILWAGSNFLRLPPEQVVLVGLGWRQLSVPSVTVILVALLVTIVTLLLLPWKPNILSPVLLWQLWRWRPPVLLLAPVSWIGVHIHWFPCIHTVVRKILPLVTSILANMGLLLPLMHSSWGSYPLLCESACHLLHQRLCMVYRHPVPVV